MYVLLRYVWHNEIYHMFVERIYGLSKSIKHQTLYQSNYIHEPKRMHINFQQF